MKKQLTPVHPPSNTTTDTDDNSHYVSCCFDTMSRCMGALTSPQSYHGFQKVDESVSSWLTHICPSEDEHWKQFSCLGHGVTLHQSGATNWKMRAPHNRIRGPLIRDKRLECTSWFSSSSMIFLSRIPIIPNEQNNSAFSLFFIHLTGEAGSGSAVYIWFCFYLLTLRHDKTHKFLYSQVESFHPGPRVSNICSCVAALTCQ